MNAAKSQTAPAEETTAAAPPIPEQPVQPPTPQPEFNPMADIIARHESAINRLKRGK